MTREEAKKILKRIVNASYKNKIAHPLMLNTEMEAINVAIEALSDVPDTNIGDTISRQAAIDALNIPDYENGEAYTQYEQDANAIRNLPPAEPKIIANQAERFRLVLTHDLVDLATGDKMRLDEPLVVNNYIIRGDSYNKAYVLNEMLNQLRDEFLKIISVEVENK